MNIQYKVEDFLSDVPHRKGSILTKQQAKEKLEEEIQKRGHGGVVTKSSVSKNGKDYYFFVDNHIFGSDLIWNVFCSCSQYLPSTCVPRPGLEDGIIDTFEKYIFIYHKDDVLIESMEELLNLFNEGVFTKENHYVSESSQEKKYEN